jgi:hypothetical protein
MFHDDILRQKGRNLRKKDGSSQDESGDQIQECRKGKSRIKAMP